MKKIIILIINVFIFKVGVSQVQPDSLALEIAKLKRDLNEIKSRNYKTPFFNFKSGLGFSTPDSSYSLNIRFRMQNRFLMNSISDNDFSPSSFEARVRRCRLSFTGHIVNPKWNYYLQLSFSRGDMDWSDVDASTQNTSPNVVRDAMIFYKPIKNLQLGFGQGKLPGNRQRVTSSGALQFYDRSIVNATFTPDRDFGFFGNYTAHIGTQFKIIPKLAITSGEGRNSSLSNTGLAYTARLEVLPLGSFTDGGDYFEGDLAHEEKPKISLAGGYQLNDLAVRSAGQLGRDLLATRSFNVYIADVLFKYKGIALSSEYIRRDTDGSPYVLGSDNKTRVITTGDGINAQISYCTKKMWEFATRYSLVTPHKDITASVKQTEQIGVGVTKYIYKHKLKVQGNVFYNHDRDLNKQTDAVRNYFAVFQIELGI